MSSEKKTNPNIKEILERLEAARHNIKIAKDVTEKVKDSQGGKRLQERIDSITKDMEEFRSRGK